MKVIIATNKIGIARIVPENGIDPHTLVEGQTGVVITDKKQIELIKKTPLNQLIWDGEKATVKTDKGMKQEREIMEIEVSLIQLDSKIPRPLEDTIKHFITDGKKYDKHITNIIAEKSKLRSNLKKILKEV